MVGRLGCQPMYRSVEEQSCQLQLNRKPSSNELRSFARFLFPAYGVMVNVVLWRNLDARLSCIRSMD